MTSRVEGVRTSRGAGKTQTRTVGTGAVRSPTERRESAEESSETAREVIRGSTEEENAESDARDREKRLDSDTAHSRPKFEPKQFKTQRKQNLIDMKARKEMEKEEEQTTRPSGQRGRTDKKEGTARREDNELKDNNLCRIVVI